MTTCYELPEFKIKLEQTGIDLFTVTYWLQVETDLDYATAARRLGEAVMHALSCDGRIDNSDPDDDEPSDYGSFEDSPRYRADMIDAGRGRLLR